MDRQWTTAITEALELMGWGDGGGVLKVPEAHVALINSVSFISFSPIFPSIVFTSGG